MKNPDFSMERVGISLTNKIINEPMQKYEHLQNNKSDFYEIAKLNKKNKHKIIRIRKYILLLDKL